MKNILVPTDFSIQASYALDTAYQLAQKFKAGLCLIHVIEFPLSDTQHPAEKMAPFPLDYLNKVKEEVLARMKAMVQERKMEDVAVEYKITPGNPYLSITRELRHEQSGLVVMGSKGASGIREVIIGSNAERMVRFSHCPVLVIKDKSDLSEVKNIVFATSLREDESKVMAELEKLQHAYDAHLHILKVNTRANFLGDLSVRKELNKFAEQYHLKNYSIHHYSDEGEEEGILHFAEDVGADLIALGTHGRRGISRMLSGSVAENMVNHAHLPVWTMNMRNQY